MLCYHRLEILSNVEPGASHFHFARGPANDVAGPAAWGSYMMTEMLFCSEQNAYIKLAEEKATWEPKGREGGGN